ncbi:MAG: DMSO/TMAO reductase YedYZ, molybdopterin-dependent catalytic subunit [Chloroflexi bacterium]|jgi:DMSO/TMAO reductase YedYZ molybdopterin-dependent catalytic subunit|nr:MAG: DMSO/TMAO reductase YedYZ, molybdopterin-dependent catalytic subunit [Chloroflexota bacterium]
MSNQRVSETAVHVGSGAIGGIAGVTFAVLVAQETRAPFVGSIAIDAAGAALSPADLSSFMKVVGEDAKTFAFSGALVALFLVAVLAWLALRPWLPALTGRHRAALTSLVAGGIFAAVIGTTAALEIVLDTPLLDDRQWGAHLGLSAGVGLVSAGTAQLIDWSLSGRGPGPPSTATGSAITRRHVLSGMLALAISGVMSYEVAQSVIATTARGGRSRLPAGVRPSPITPTNQFYVVSKNLFDPRVDESNWRLSIGGLVEQSVELELNDLQAMGSSMNVQTLICISNEVGGHLISTARWTGVSLASVLEHARPRVGATHALFHCEDGYSDSLPLEAINDPRTRLVWDMNGEPLTQAHGFPLRLLVPGRYGLKNPKWIREIELVPEAVPGYWQQRGWSQDAFVRTMSRIDAPAAGSPTVDPLLVQGIAFAGERGISAVEVSSDDGASWRSAALMAPVSALSWALWETTINRPAATGVLVARAKDGNGITQDETERPPLPSGASGYHQREFG